MRNNCRVCLSKSIPLPRSNTGKLPARIFNKTIYWLQAQLALSAGMSLKGYEAYANNPSGKKSYPIIPDPCFIYFICIMPKITNRQAKVLAILWFLIISILFFLPGSAFPEEGWLDKIYFDKWVHFGFFALLLFLWRFYFPALARYNWLMLCIAFVYGFSVEVIQHYLIANRSFDLGDVAADMSGAAAGILVWQWYIKK